MLRDRAPRGNAASDRRSAIGRLTTGGAADAPAEQETIAGFYEAVARLLGCAPEEVAFAESASRAWDLASYAMRFSPGDRILTAVAEHGSNVIAYLQQARRHVPNGGGLVNPAEYALSWGLEAISDRIDDLAAACEAASPRSRRLTGARRRLGSATTTGSPQTAQTP